MTSSRRAARRGYRARKAQTALIAFVIASCAGSPSSGSSPPASDPGEAQAPPEWLTVEADYPRYLHHVRRVNLETRNTGPADVIITRRLLRADHFEDVVAVEDRVSTVRAGSQVDIQAEFGQVRSCDDGGPFDAWVEYDYTTDPAAPPVRVVIPIDPVPLDEIRDRECAQRAVLEAVEIRFEDPWVDGSRAGATITLTRVEGDEQVRVESLLGSVIFTMVPALPADGILAELPPGEEGTTLPVAFEVARCDPHAVGQSTKTYELTLWVAVGDRPAQAVPFTAGAELRPVLDAILDECLAGGA